jgi:hypothetical protein
VIHHNTKALESTILILNHERMKWTKDISPQLCHQLRKIAPSSINELRAMDQAADEQHAPDAAHLTGGAA